MTNNKILLGLHIGLIAISAIGYRNPTFGATATISLIVIAAILNSLIEINSPKAGRIFGLLIGLASIFSSLGAHLTRIETIILSIAATAAGYISIATPTRIILSEEERIDLNKTRPRNYD